MPPPFKLSVPLTLTVPALLKIGPMVEVPVPLIVKVPLLATTPLLLIVPTPDVSVIVEPTVLDMTDALDCIQMASFQAIVPVLITEPYNSF